MGEEEKCGRMSGYMLGEWAWYTVGKRGNSSETQPFYILLGKITGTFGM